MSPAALTAAARRTAWWTAPADPRLLAAQRIAVGAFALGYLLIRFPALVRVRDLPDDRFEPVGPVALLVDAPLPGSAVVALALVAIVAAAAVTAGWHHRVTGPALALSLLWVLTYRHSWGVVLHTDNLLVLHAAILAVVPAADAWSLDARRSSATWGRSGAYRWPLVVMGAVTAAAYVVAGWAKIRNGGWAWFDGDVLRSHVASDNLRKDLLGDVSSPIAGPLLGASWLWAPMAIVAMVIELGAPLAVLAPRLGRWWAVAAWGFHVGVLALMAIFFPYQLLGVALLPWVLAGRGLPRPETHADAASTLTTPADMAGSRHPPD